MLVTLTFSNCINVEFSITNGGKTFTILSDSDVKHIKILDCNADDTFVMRHNSVDLINLEDIRINYISFKNLIVNNSEFWKVVDSSDQLIGDHVVTIGSPDKCILKIPDQLYERYLDKLSDSCNTYHIMMRPFD